MVIQQRVIVFSIQQPPSANTALPMQKAMAATSACSCDGVVDLVNLHKGFDGVLRAASRVPARRIRHTSAELQPACKLDVLWVSCVGCSLRARTHAQTTHNGTTHTEAVSCEREQKELYYTVLYYFRSYMNQITAQMLSMRSPQRRHLSTSASAGLRILLGKRPVANQPVTVDCFDLRKGGCGPPAPVCAAGALGSLSADMLYCRTLLVSVDPFLRCRFNEATGGTTPRLMIWHRQSPLLALAKFWPVVRTPDYRASEQVTWCSNHSTRGRGQRPPPFQRRPSREYLHYSACSFAPRLCWVQRDSQD